MSDSHLPSGDDIVQVMRGPHMLLGASPLLVHGPAGPRLRRQPQLVGQARGGRGGRVRRVHVDGLRAPVQEEEAAHYRAQTTHCLGEKGVD